MSSSVSRWSSLAPILILAASAKRAAEAKAKEAAPKIEPTPKAPAKQAPSRDPGDHGHETHGGPFEHTDGAHDHSNIA